MGSEGASRSEIGLETSPHPVSALEAWRAGPGHYGNPVFRGSLVPRNSNYIRR